MLRYRYILQLREGGRESTVRHVSFQPLRVGDVVTVPGHGEWRITEIVTTETVFNDGIAYAEPARDETLPIDRCAS